MGRISNPIAIAPMVLTAVVAATFPSSDGNAALRRPAFLRNAVAQVAYEKSKANCVYSDHLVKVLNEIDEVVRREDDETWQQAKSDALTELVALENTASLMGSTSPCGTYGLAVGGIMPIYLVTVSVDKTVLAEMNGLMRGGGRSRSAENAEASGEQDHHASGTDSSTGGKLSPIEAWQQQNPNFNRPRPGAGAGPHETFHIGSGGGPPVSGQR